MNARTSINDTIATYDEIAVDYAREFETKPDLEQLEEFASKLPKGGKVLDVGCASGRDTSWFTSKGFDAIGIDLSEKLLLEAKKYHPEIKTGLMDMRHLEFENGSFDGIWSHASLLHIPKLDVPDVLVEFYRVLKISGMCFIQVKRGEGEKIVDDGNGLGRKRLMVYFELDEVERFLKNAGFVIEQPRTYARGIL